MHGIESRKKTYVEAVVDIDPDGRQRPLAIYWGDGRCFVVDRVLESRRAASMKATGSAIPLRSAEGQSTFGIATTADGT